MERCGVSSFGVNCSVHIRQNRDRKYPPISADNLLLHPHERLLILSLQLLPWAPRSGTAPKTSRHHPELVTP
eukprot:1150340-Pelagomonas_calceolata.AAC.2